MLMQTYSRGCSDYVAIRDLANDPAQHPVEVSESEFYEMLECVPPIYIPGVHGFLVGEPITRDHRGTVYANYFQSRDGLYCARYHCIKSACSHEFERSGFWSGGCCLYICRHCGFEEERDRS